jgi:probable rRNA maturation factor
MKILIEINCDSVGWKKNKLLPLENIKKFAYAPIAKTLEFLSFSCKEIVFSILLTSDKKIQKLNLEHRGKNSPTNVLSFPYLEEDMLKNLNLYSNDEIYAGDMAFAYETILRESQEKAWPLECSEKIFQDYFSHLIVHSILHIFGFDHQNEEEAEEMEKKEILILKELNIDNPYKSIE